MESIDVYHQWLGIPPQHQPPSHYCLLGISDFESDTAVIRSAAERQAMHVRRLSRGRFVDAGQNLLNEIAFAKINLMDSEKRLAYDASLRSEMDNAEPTMNVDDIESPESRSTYLKDERDSKHDTTAHSNCVVRRSPVEATFLNPNMYSPTKPGPWVLGYHSDCDISVNHETVSGMHCRISFATDHWQIADLKSTNGTFVNGKRVVKQALDPTDLIVLGGDHRIVLPSQWFRKISLPDSVMFVGRAPGNELQIDSEKVSRFHARAIRSGDSIVIDDLQSAHGTFVVDRNGNTTRIVRHVMQAGESVRFADTLISIKEFSDLMTRSSENHHPQ